MLKHLYQIMCSDEIDGIPVLNGLNSKRDRQMRACKLGMTVNFYTVAELVTRLAEAKRVEPWSV
ncbi:hypothetical protein [Paenibacillus sabuli]|uniref:hypothetical protein n=1 Tax=Paenibacillus sabuli TaxID=2772509 RepID=UPI001CC2EEF6|nr:hypothetical protein [Paenibacillus sabuli]